MKKKMWAVLIAASMVVTSMMGFSTTAAAAEEEMELVWLHHYAEEGIRNWITFCSEKFMEIHPNVKITQEFVGADTYTQMLTTRIGGDDSPTFFDPMNGRSDLKRFVESGIVADLSDLENLKNLDPGILMDSQVDGKQYGLSVDMNAYGAFYNKELWAEKGYEIPTTYTELIALCDQMEADGITPIAMGASDVWVLNRFIIAFADQCKGLGWGPSKQSGETNFADDEVMREALTKAFSMKKYMGYDPGGGTNDSCLAAIANGEAGFYVNGTWTLDGIKTKNPDCTPSFFVLPVSDDMSQNRAMFAAGNPFCVYNYTEEKDQAKLAMAKEFANYLISEEGCNAYASIGVKLSACPLVDFSFNEGLMDTAAIPQEQRMIRAGDETMQLTDEYNSIWQETISEYFTYDDFDYDTFAEDIDERFAMVG